MAERLEFSASKTLQNSHARKVLGTITPRFKREATAWCSRMRRNENGKRRYTGTLLTFQECFNLFIHSLKFYLFLIFIKINLYKMLFLKLGGTCVFIEIFIYLNVSNISKYILKNRSIGLE